jgi:hypothetical protein
MYHFLGSKVKQNAILLSYYHATVCTSAYFMHLLPACGPSDTMLIQQYLYKHHYITTKQVNFNFKNIIKDGFT